MSLKNDVETVDDHIIYCEYTTNEDSLAWERIKTALEPLLSNDMPKSEIVDSTPVYRCKNGKCGFETRTNSEHVQYCPCGEKMELVG